MIKTCFIISCVVLAVLGETQKCAVSDKNCLLQKANEGYQALFEGKEESLDPMHQDLIDGNLSILKFKLKDTTVTGFKQCKVSDVKLDMKSLNAVVELTCPEFHLDGQYDIKGRLIVLPVEGNGDYFLHTKAYKLHIEGELKEVKKDGKTYYAIKSFQVKPHPLEPINFDFRNLFNGQQDLADAVLKFANENWKEVAYEVQDPVFTANMKKIVTVANKSLKNVNIGDHIDF